MKDNMRHRWINSVACLVVGAALGAIAVWSMQSSKSEESPDDIDQAILAMMGEASFNGVAVGYKTTTGVRYDIQYSAPPASKRRSFRPHVMLASADKIQINDGVHHVISRFDAGKVFLNDIEYVSSLPERELSLIRQDVDGYIQVFGDGRIHVNNVPYVPIDSPNTGDSTDHANQTD